MGTPLSAFPSCFQAHILNHPFSLHPFTRGVSLTHSDGVVIAKVDADKERSLGERFEVKGFPTIKWFPKVRVHILFLFVLLDANATDRHTSAE